jgi:hypothetical protein
MYIKNTKLIKMNYGLSVIRNFATTLERDFTAELREKFHLPREVKKIVNNIVHEKHDKQTTLRIPKQNSKWKVRKQWNSFK